MELRHSRYEFKYQKVGTVTSINIYIYIFVVWEIAAGAEPHTEEDQLVVVVQIRDSGFTPAIPPNCDPALKDVMEMCWQLDPNNRSVSTTTSTSFVRAHPN